MTTTCLSERKLEGLHHRSFYAQILSSMSCLMRVAHSKLSRRLMHFKTETSPLLSNSLHNSRVKRRIIRLTSKPCLRLRSDSLLSKEIANSLRMKSQSSAEASNLLYLLNQAARVNATLPASQNSSMKMIIMQRLRSTLICYWFSNRWHLKTKCSRIIWPCRSILTPQLTWKSPSVHQAHWTKMTHSMRSKTINPSPRKVGLNLSHHSDQAQE